MNNYTSDRVDAVLTWIGLTIVGTVFFAYALWLGGGPQEKTLAPAGGTSATCVQAVAPEDIHLWIDRLGGWVDYEGTTGYWRDAYGNVVGHSSAEDSDVCSYV